MTLIERLRSAEHQGREAAWHGFTRARASLEEAQSQLRRKMRIHPRTAKANIPVFVSAQEKLEVPAHHPIVSVNGHDLPPEEQKTKEQVA